MKNIINGSSAPETIDSLMQRIGSLRECQKTEEIERGGQHPEKTDHWHEIEAHIKEIDSLMQEISTVGEKEYRIYFRCMNSDSTSEVHNCITEYLVKKEGKTMSSTDTLYLKTMTVHLTHVANLYAARQCRLLADRLSRE